MNKDLSEIDKQRLVEYRKKYYEMQKIIVRSLNKAEFFIYKSRWKCSDPRTTKVPVFSYKSSRKYSKHYAMLCYSIRRCSRRYNFSLFFLILKFFDIFQGQVALERCISYY